MTLRTRLALTLAILGAGGLPLLISTGSLSALSTPPFSPNQELPLPLLAPVPTPLSPLAFVVRGLEPSSRTDAQGAIYVSSIRGVPGGVDLHRWSPLMDPPPNPDGTLPFKYEGQPDNCGVLTNGCANNVDNHLNPGLAPGGGDVDIAVNAPDPITDVPNLPLVSLTLAPGITGTHSTDRGDSFSPPNLLVAAIPGDDRQWLDAVNSRTVYLNYHDVATFNIEVQRSSDGGLTYVDGFGEAIDLQTFPAAGGVPATNSANVAGQIKIDRSGCPSQGNLYVVFVAPDTALENTGGQPLRSVYVGVSTDVKMGLPVFTFTDHKVFTSPSGSLGATNGTDQIFPALAVDEFGFVYAVWSDNSRIWLSSSSDQGSTWSPPLQVNQGSTVGNANVFPWVAADANGHVVVVWLGDDRPGNSNDRTLLEPGHPPNQGAACVSGATCMTAWANWNVYLAETTDGHDAFPLFSQAVASDHVIHRGTVSTGGLGGGADRSLADLFQVSLDPDHRASMAFSDDHKVHPLCSQLGSRQCGSDDPRTTRLIRAYFTRQLQTTQGISTTGSCAGSGAAETGRKITGGGRLGPEVNFGFIAKETPLNGALQYQDTSQNVKAHSSNGITGVTFNGNCATFNGNAKVNNNPGYTFSVTACDNGDPNPGAGRDTFSITLGGPNFTYQKGGTITQGDIEMH